MSLTHHEIEKLWRQQEAILSDRPASWIIQVMWVFPLVLLFPLLIAKFSTNVVTGCGIASGAYLFYGIITYLACRLWDRSAKESISQRRITALLVLGFMGLSMLFLSATFLLAAMLCTEYLPFDGNNIALALGIMYGAQSMFLIARAAYFLRNALNSPTRSLQPETRSLLWIQSSVVGIGVLVGIVFGKSAFGWIVAVGLATLGAFLLLPFSVIVLYQVVIMAWSWFFKGRDGTDCRKCAT